MHVWVCITSKGPEGVVERERVVLERGRVRDAGRVVLQC